MDRLQPLGKADDQFADADRPETPGLVHPHGERRARDVIHHHPLRGVANVGRDQIGGPRTADTLHGPHLPGEACAEFQLSRQLVSDDLDRDPGAIRLLAEVDHPHPALADAVGDPVRAEGASHQVWPTSRCLGRPHRAAPGRPRGGGLLSLGRVRSHPNTVRHDRRCPAVSQLRPGDPKVTS